jgi:hypothetical protein
MSPPIRLPRARPKQYYVIRRTAVNSDLRRALPSNFLYLDAEDFSQPIWTGEKAWAYWWFTKEGAQKYLEKYGPPAPQGSQARIVKVVSK